MDFKKNILIIITFLIFQNILAFSQKNSFKSISEKTLYSTVRIETVDKNGSVYFGTGFFFRFYLRDSIVKDVIITNKHVVKNMVKGIFYFRLKDKNNSPISKSIEKFKIYDFEDKWRNHPDSLIDLCFFDLSLYNYYFNKINKPLFYIPIEASIIPTNTDLKSFFAMQEIVMIGYPIALWDSVNNFPIFRKGATATYPLYDYNGEKEFLVDIAAFPGSSGSPVFILDEGGYYDNRNNYRQSSRIFFMGVLYGGPQTYIQGKAFIPDQKTNNFYNVLSSLPINLGCVIKSSVILDFIKLLE